MERTRRDQLFFFWFMPLFSLAFCIAAWLVGNPLPGLWSIWQTAAPFLTDPIATVGLSAALFNSGTMGLLAWCALWLSQIRPTGRAFAPFSCALAPGCWAATCYPACHNPRRLPLCCPTQRAPR